MEGSLNALPNRIPRSASEEAPETIALSQQALTLVCSKHTAMVLRLTIDPILAKV
jgi:hypothetical protein